MEKFEAVFEKEKPTKNTIRYLEQTEGGHPPALRTIYIQRWKLGNPVPEKVKVTVEEVK